MNQQSKRTVITGWIIGLCVLAGVGMTIWAISSSRDSSDQHLDSGTGTCPNNIVIQTDWWPEAEHGALYHALGENAQFDKEQRESTGHININGKDIKLTVRYGADAVGWQSTFDLLYLDETITLAIVNLVEANLNYERRPTLSVLPLLNVNPAVVAHKGDTNFGPETVAVPPIDEGFFTITEANGELKHEQTFVVVSSVAAQFLADDQTKGALFFDGSDTAIKLPDGGWLYDRYPMYRVGSAVYAQNLAIRTDRYMELQQCLHHFIPYLAEANNGYLNDQTIGRANIVEAGADAWGYDGEWHDAALTRLFQSQSFVTNPRYNLTRVDDMLRKAGDNTGTALLATNEFVN